MLVYCDAGTWEGSSYSCNRPQLTVRYTTGYWGDWKWDTRLFYFCLLFRMGVTPVVYFDPKFYFLDILLWLADSGSAIMSWTGILGILKNVQIYSCLLRNVSHDAVWTVDESCALKFVRVQTSCHFHTDYIFLLIWDDIQYNNSQTSLCWSKWPHVILEHFKPPYDFAETIR